MSTRQTGNRHENSFCDLAEDIGYCTFPARGSRGIVDVICFAAEGEEYNAHLVPLAVQVGTHGKAIAKTLAELISTRRPIGSLCIVARRCVKNRRVTWKFHTSFGTFASLRWAIEAREEAA